MLGVANIPSDRDWRKDMRNIQSHNHGIDMSPAMIVAHLHERGCSLRGLARAHGLNHTTLAQALRGSYPASERIIAAALRMRPQQIWPSRYARRLRPQKGGAR